MSSRRVKPAVVLASNIGANAADLHSYGYFQTIEALDFLHRVNPDVFDWLREMLNAAHAQRALKKLRADKAQVPQDDGTSPHTTTHTDK